MIINRLTRLRWRRQIRHGRKQVENISVQAEEHIEKHFFKRLARLFDVRRFVVSWILLLAILCGIVGLQLNALTAFYQELQPVAGGSYSEGMVGDFTNANPIFATELVDSTVSRLVFAGILKYDNNNQLVGDLAESWKVSKDGKTYTIVLKPN